MLKVSFCLINSKATIIISQGIEITKFRNFSSSMTFYEAPCTLIRRLHKFNVFVLFMYLCYFCYQRVAESFMLSVFQLLVDNYAASQAKQRCQRRVPKYMRPTVQFPSDSGTDSKLGRAQLAVGA